MSRLGNPYDNAQCESFMKTLKYEEVYRSEYRDLAEARAQIGRVLGKDLQPKRPALGVGLPASGQVRGAADRAAYGGGCAATDRMSFLRHRRSIHPMGKEQAGSRLDAYPRLSSARMSRSPLFLGGPVSTGALLCFTGCAQNAVQRSCRSSNLQRTANRVLFGCLSRGVHPICMWKIIRETCLSWRHASRPRRRAVSIWRSCAGRKASAVRAAPVVRRGKPDLCTYLRLLIVEMAVSFFSFNTSEISVTAWL